ncbi:MULTISPECIES: FRG domain-containing protein [unclassified Paenibacillus]|uniref:FRG domain-containing protein n=1 Tax=unclassified Paenibacillus TaxID=185978 RepID=UPI0015E4063A|nr:MULTISPECIES: FRG domain-containing protein [unclassified Paenibacillus]QZN75734.1 FRG domain-containing protein [Paenibacillus sp. DR312]
MKKFVYFSKNIPRTERNIVNLLSETNEALIWYINTEGTKVTAMYVNNKLGRLEKEILYKSENESFDLTNIDFIDNSYTPVDSRFKLFCSLKVENLIEYIKIIDIINGASEFVFRGQRDVTWNLQASIFRKNYTENKEFEIYRDIRKNKFENLTRNTFLDNLIHMQHYGIPTRLLDWSRNPLISLFFACSDEKNDGKVFAYRPKLIYQFYDKEYEVLSNYLKEDFNKTQLNSDSVKFLAAIGRGAQSEAIFIESTIENERLKAQKGLFSIQIDIKSNYIEPIKDEILKSTSLFKKDIIDMRDLREISVNNSYETQTKLNTILDKYPSYSSKIADIEKEAERHFVELTENRYWTLSEMSNDNALDNYSIEFFIPKDQKKKIKQQLESININAMTVYPDFAGFVQYIIEKYEG